MSRYKNMSYFARKVLFIGVVLLPLSLVIFGCSISGNAAPISDRTVAAGTPHSRIANHKLAWADDFSGSTLDTAVWRYDTDNNGNTVGWGNSEQQWYTSSTQNAYLRDGSLVIEARSERMGNKSYTSARLHTHGARAFQYGVIEAQIRMPTGSNGQPDRGIFPAFWMLGDNFDGWGHGTYNGDTRWPNSGEIDIVEVLVAQGLNKVFGTAHWHEPNRASCLYSSYSAEHCSGPKIHDKASNTLYSSSHIYGIEWTPDVIKWYFDYEQYATLDIRGSQYDEFREPFFLLINLALGGLGETPQPSNYPQRLVVDWVRHYCPTDSSGACTTMLVPTPTPPSVTSCPTGTARWVYGDCSSSVGTAIAGLNRETAPDAPIITATDITTNGARGTSNAFKVTRTGGSYGGVGYKNNDSTEDLSSYSNLTFSYRLASGTHPGFFVKVESSSSACNEHTLSGLVADGQWHEITVPTSSLYGASNSDGCTTTPMQNSVNVPFYLFATGTGNIDIDEIYYH